MIFLITFLEGIISFVSPCNLPLLPVYISYFNKEEDSSPTLLKVILFIIGFTSVFVLLGIFAGTLGSFFINHKTIINLVCGILIILFGLTYLELIPFPSIYKTNFQKNITDGFSAFLFGIIYSINIGPCTGAFLGSALTMASNSSSYKTGALLLFTYSIGIGIPFIFSTLFLKKLRATFNFVKNHYKIINAVSGSLLILIGILIAAGLFDKLQFL